MCREPEWVNRDRRYGYMKIEEMTSYRLVEKKKIEDLNSMSYLLEHKKERSQDSVAFQ